MHLIRQARIANILRASSKRTVKPNLLDLTVQCKYLKFLGQYFGIEKVRILVTDFYSYVTAVKLVWFSKISIIWALLYLAK